ncbi:hypothetical protein ACIBSV_37235 [Embleya sp. NPDC050154]|uniref:hypothetical protein n=1 Tax=Embleya sp. NPDC050154 TaxID=3363988 RepID=UPI0037AE5BDF
MSTHRTLTASTVGPVCPDITTTLGSVDIIVEQRRRARIDLRTTQDTGPLADAVRAATIREYTATGGAPVLEIHIPKPRSGTNTVHGGGVSYGTGVIGNITIGGRHVVTNGRVVSAHGVRADGAEESATITLEVRLPARSSLRATTGAADLRVRGHLQVLGAQTISGDVVADIADTLAAHSTSGDVRAGHVTDRLQATTVSRDITVATYTGNAFAARTTSGRHRRHCPAHRTRRAVRDHRLRRHPHPPAPPASTSAPTPSPATPATTEPNPRPRTGRSPRRRRTARSAPASNTSSPA